MEEFHQECEAMFNGMAQGAFFQLADGSLIDVNPAALTMFGVSREEFMGRTSEAPEWLVINEDGQELTFEQHPSMVSLRTGQPVTNFVAGVFNHRQQAFVWLNISAIPMFHQGEQAPYKVFVTLHDITEQKRSNDIHLSRIHLMEFADSHPLEQFLVEALNRLETLTGSETGFYHFYDHKTRCVSLQAWSTNTTKAFCRAESYGHYGVDRAGVWAECIVKDSVVVHNDYASLPNRRGLPEGHAPVTRELLVPVKRNGHIVAIVGLGNKPADYTEADVNTASRLADLTWDMVERKRAEALLLEANAKLQTLTNTSMDGYWIIDAEGRIIFANQRCCQIYGYGQEEIVTKRLCDFEANEDESALDAHLALIRKKGCDRFETRMYRKNGEIIDVEVSAAFVRQTNQILAFNRDLTSHNQMQKELLKSKNELELVNQRLEQRVYERTAELQAAIREQEAFSYSVSHDLRAPLRHINSFSAILMEDHADELSKPAWDYLHRMRAAANRMGALIDHLLELSRVIRAEIKLDQVDLSRIADETMRMLIETELHRKVEYRIDPGLVVYGDKLLLRQLLGNLLQNAWKYSSSKTPACIEFQKKVIEGEAVYLVKDNGAGFDMNYREKLFKPFERLHGSEFEGVGIGLATAQRIVQRHGGRIWGEGKAEEGATFYFTLG